MYSYEQCCQLLTKLFGQINQKILRWRKNSAPYKILFINANITVFYTLSRGKENKKLNISGDEVYFSADTLSFFI
jgi:hypothetical protein